MNHRRGCMASKHSVELVGSPAHEIGHSDQVMTSDSWQSISVGLKVDGGQSEDTYSMFKGKYDARRRPVLSRAKKHGTKAGTAAGYIALAVGITPYTKVATFPQVGIETSITPRKTPD